jgi:flagellar protein FliL
MFGQAVAPGRPPPGKFFPVKAFHPTASGIFLARPPVTRLSREGDVPLMEPTKAPEAAAPPPGSKPKRKGKFLIIVVLAVIVLGGGGAAGYWIWAGSHAAAAAEATADTDTSSDGHGDGTTTPKKKKSAENQGLVEFPGFLVNLADAGGQAYLRVTLSLLVADEEQAKLFEAKPALKSLLRSAILEVLALQTGGVLVTPDGKEALKAAIIEKIASLEQGVEVEDVLFADFVVQY